MVPFTNEALSQIASLNRICSFARFGYIENFYVVSSCSFYETLNLNRRYKIEIFWQQHAVYLGNKINRDINTPSASNDLLLVISSIFHNVIIREN